MNVNATEFEFFKYHMEDALAEYGRDPETRHHSTKDWQNLQESTTMK
jgi:hypothetical protein